MAGNRIEGVHLGLGCGVSHGGEKRADLAEVEHDVRFRDFEHFGPSGLDAVVRVISKASQQVMESTGRVEVRRHRSKSLRRSQADRHRAGSIR